MEKNTDTAWISRTVQVCHSYV